MRNLYKKVLKRCFSRFVIRRRDALQLTQEQMAEILNISGRSYADLEREKTAPSGLSLAIYLAYLCEDPGKLAQELRIAFDAESENIAQI